VSDGLSGEAIVESEKPRAELDDLYASMVLKEMQPDEKLLFARLEDPVPRMIVMTKALLALVIMLLIFDIYVKHHSPPSLGNFILFVIVWLIFLLLFRKVYKVVDAITTQRFIRVRPGISVHYGWLKDIEKVNLSKPRNNKTDMEILLKESGKYEARNLKRPEMKPRVHNGVKKITISNLEYTPQLKAVVDDLAKSIK
jgi:hypothetical protein